MDSVVERTESGRIPSPEEILLELEKIFSSQAFKHADSQRALLRYVVEQSLQGREDQIKEYSIGIEVFHRKESFDPRRDNTVRVKARRLRWTLAKYYEAEGATDPVRIEFPTGTYRPVFGFSVVSPQTEPIPSAQPATNEVHLAPPPAIPTPSAAEPASKPVIAETQEVPPARPRWKVAWQIPAAVLAILLCASTVYFLRLRGAAASAMNTKPSIAVLPFRIVNADKREEFFSDGLTEDVTDSLAQVPGLRVVASSSAFQYKGQDVDVRKVGRELSVGVVLEGSVQKFENHVRITTQLSDATTGFHLWSSSYDRELKDVLAIQREIADSIASSLGITLTESAPGEAKPSIASRDPEAYEAFLKGRYLLAKQTPEAINAAIQHFKSSIAKDPAYAPAYAGLASSYAAIPVITTTAQDFVPKIKEAAFKALTLDANLSEPHVDLARAYIYDYQWPLAEQELKKALQLRPGVAEEHGWYGHFLFKTGHLEESLAEFKKALSLDPISPASNRNVARSLYFLRRYDEAIKLYQESLELEPDSRMIHRQLGLAYMMKGMGPAAVAEMEAARGLNENSWTIVEPGFIYAAVGKTDTAREILDKLLQRAAQQPPRSPSLEIAQVYIGLGNKDKALEWLRKAVDEQNVNVSLKADPIYDSLRSDPRFEDLLRRMNLR